MISLEILYSPEELFHITFEHFASLHVSLFIWEGLIYDLQDVATYSIAVERKFQRFIYNGI